MEGSGVVIQERRVHQNDETEIGAGAEFPTPHPDPLPCMGEGRLGELGHPALVRLRWEKNGVLYGRVSGALRLKTATANHIWNQMKDRLQLTEEQIPKIEPIFRAGFAEGRAIQEQSDEKVEAIIRANHQEISTHLTDTQRAELEKMHSERQNFLMKRGGPPSSSTNKASPPTPPEIN